MSERRDESVPFVSENERDEMTIGTRSAALDPARDRRRAAGTVLVEPDVRDR